MSDPGASMLSFSVLPTTAICCACAKKLAATADCRKCTTSNATPCEAAARKVHVGRWVLGVSTGHVATATFSKQKCYRPVLKSRFTFDFEASHSYGDQAGEHAHHPAAAAGIKVWYQRLAVLNASARRLESRRFVQQVLIPDMLLTALKATTEGATNLTFVDMGHHINLGLMEPLAWLLRPAISFVRVIRSRFGTARSFFAEKKWPCGAGMWTLCPTTHPDIVLMPTDQVWSSLSPVQRNLWYIDEVEARWQRLLSTSPGLSHLTVRWCNRAQVEAAWASIASFVGDGAIHPETTCTFHEHGSESANISDEALVVEDRQYDVLMQYTWADRLLVQAVRRPNDCAAAVPLR